MSKRHLRALLPGFAENKREGGPNNLVNKITELVKNVVTLSKIMKVSGNVRLA